MKKRVLITWFVSYIIIMMIPMAVSGIVYNRSIRTIESETIRANSAMLRQLKQVFDKELKDISNVGIRMSLNYRLMTVMNDENMTEQSKIRMLYDDLSELQKDMKSYKISNALIKEFYIYFCINDLALTDSSFGKSQQLFNTIHINGEMGYDEWKGIMQKRHENCFEMLPVYSGGNSAALMRSLPAGDISKVSANIVILLDESVFRKAVENITLLGKGSTFIMDSEDNVLFSSGTKKDGEYPEYKSLDQSGKAEIINRKDGAYAVLFEKSDIADWKYVSVLPYTIFNQKARQTERIIYAGIVLCLVIGSLAAFLLAKRNYNPINDIVSILAGKAGAPLNKGYNEFRYISDAVTNTLNQNDAMNKKLKQQDMILNSNMLTKLLKGRTNKNELLLESLKGIGVEVEAFYNYGIETEQKLLNCIRVGDFPDACKLLEEVFTQNFSGKEVPIYVAKCMMFDLAGTFLKSLDKDGCSVGNMDLATGRFVGELMKCETIEELKEQILKTLKIFCDESSNRNNNGHDKLIKSIVDIIKTNYTDANLNIVMIADKLDMNPKYISAVFKEITGKSILDVINRTRIEKAKSLLKEQEMSIAGTAVEAGYYDSKALIRAFRKYEGITPGQYRENV